MGVNQAEPKRKNETRQLNLWKMVRKKTMMDEDSDGDD